jgi:hypothetical protein
MNCNNSQRFNNNNSLVFLFHVQNESDFDQLNIFTDE